MSDGEAHLKFWRLNTLVSAPVSVAVYWITTYMPATGYKFGGGTLTTSPLSVVVAGEAIGNLLGVIVEPDLDQIGVTSSEGRAMRALKLIGVIWTMYWMPYAYLFKHRSYFSHGYIVSTAIRFAYCFWWLWFYNPSELIKVFMFGIFLGLCRSDAVHIVKDVR